MPESTDFSRALETLFRELNDRWLNESPDRQSLTDERVLREIALPSGSRTRLCFFSVPEALLSRYREVVFPLADEAGLVPVGGPEIVSWGGPLLPTIDALIERSEVVIGDVSTGLSSIWNEVRSAASRKPPPAIALVMETDQVLEEALISQVQVFRRSHDWLFSDTLPNGAGISREEDWLELLGGWLRSVSYSILGSVEDEAVRLLSQSLYRPAVIAAVAALEVVLREVLEKADWLPRHRLRVQKRSFGLGELLQGAVEMDLLSQPQVDDLRKTQAIRNRLIHSRESIDGRRARAMVDRTLKIVRRLRGLEPIEPPFGRGSG